jgi:hypothetical protein
MAAITSTSITLRGRVNSRVTTLYANGTPVTLGGDHTFAHTVIAGADQLVTLTTIDAQGLTETRAVRIERETVPYVAPAAV